MLVIRIINSLKQRLSTLIILIARHSHWGGLTVGLWKLSGLHFEGREIRHGCYFDNPKNVFIGKGTFINYRNTFHTSGGNAEIIIGSNCDIAPDCMFMCTSHLIGKPERRAGKLNYKQIHIGDGCWIGTRSVILPGVSIGDGCVVAAGSVVTKDAPKNVLIGGVPAKIIRELI